MAPAPDLTFGPFRLDGTHDCLWRGAQVLALRRRSLGMLRYLAAHPGRLVTKAELRQHVWAGTHVTDTVLRVCVQEIRAALGDAAAAPQYLATVGRQGYQFLVGDAPEVAPPRLPGPLVGRHSEVDTVASWFQRAAQGARQLAFVSGPAGVGKTTVVELWLARLGAGSGVRIAWGHCVEHAGEGEPYLPFLEALGDLSRGPQPRGVLDTLRRAAPLWLVQLPGLLPDTELERLQRQVQGATATRMLRELAELLDALSAKTPLVVVLEDLQWSDRSTVEALAYLAQRRAPARLVLLGTYRPVDALLQGHVLRPMVQELCGRGQAVELRLEVLSAADVAAYVTGRLGGPVAARLAAFIHERTEGHALFLVTIVEHLVDQGLVVQRAGQWTLQDGVEAQVRSLPNGLRQFLMRRLEALPPAERRVLEAASVVGERFTVAAVAAGAQCPVEEVEAVCEALAAQQHVLADLGLRAWPDGTSSGRYRFGHALYRQVLYEGLGSARRREVHRHIGLRLEAGYGAQVGEVAARLAVHFERGGEVPRAVQYWQQTGDNAVRRNAHDEAVDALTKGLALLATQSESPARARHELPLQLTLADLLMATQGRMAPDVGAAYTRAHALCHQVGEPPQRFRALWGLVQFHVGHGQLCTASALSQQLFHLAQHQPEPVCVLEGHLAMGFIALYRGDFLAARTHLEHSLCLADALQSPPPFREGFVFGVSPLTWLSQVLWALGYADQAQQRCQEAHARARQVGHTVSVMYTELFAAMLAQGRRDVAATQTHAEAVMTLATAHGLALRVEQGRILRGWALAMRGDAANGMRHLRQALAAYQGIGPVVDRPLWLALLGEASSQAGQPEAGLTALDEAVTLAATMEERRWEAELYRLKGTLLLQLPRPDVPQAEACFQQALAIARRQQAKSWELRVALSLSRLWQQQGNRAEAYELLAPIYGWFTEGFDTADLQEAQALLGELGG